jgi:hypothetical protein
VVEFEYMKVFLLAFGALVLLLIWNAFVGGDPFGA